MCARGEGLRDGSDVVPIILSSSDHIKFVRSFLDIVSESIFFSLEMFRSKPTQFLRRPLVVGYFYYYYFLFFCRAWTKNINTRSKITNRQIGRGGRSLFRRDNNSSPLINTTTCDGLIIIVTILWRALIVSKKNNITHDILMSERMHNNIRL